MIFLEKIFFLIGEKKLKVFYLSILFTISSLLEVIGIGVIVSFISLFLGINDIFLQKIIDFLHELLPNNFIADQIVFLGVLLIITFLLKTIIILYINYITEKFSRNIEFSLKEKLLSNFIFLPDKYYSKKNISKQIETIIRLTQIIQGPCVSSILKLLSTILQFTGIFTLLLFTDVFTTLIVIAFIFTLGLIYTQIIKPFSKKYAQQESIASKNLIQSVYELADGISELKIFSKTKFFLDRFLKYSKQVYTNSLKTSVLFFFIKPSLELLIVTIFVSIILFLKINSIDLTEYFSIFAIFSFSLVRLMPLSTEVISSLNRVISSRYAVDTIYDEIKNLKKNSQDIDENNIENFIFKKIEFKNINFGYDEDKSILKNINFTIKTNSFVGVTGKSGSGKTTLVNLIMGKLHPIEGEIILNDTSIRDNVKNFQKKISYIQQNSFVFEGDLKTNISLSQNPETNKLIKSLEQSELLEFYNENKDKSFGDRGALLSGGQKQRIAIARAFYHDRDILILDEFTSQLDNETEKNILNYIEKIKTRKTIILISHNHDLLKNCDKVINLDN